MEEPKIVEIANAHKKNSAQVLLRYQVQRGIIVIPKSVTQSRIVTNINIFDFALSEDEMKTIDAFDRNGRLCPETG
jgi:aldehyde reductase